MSAAATPPATPHQALLGAVDSVIPSAKQEHAHTVADYLGPSIIYTLGSDTLRTLVDAPERLLRNVGPCHFDVGMSPYLSECRCGFWGRRQTTARPARRGIFESLLVEQICRRFPDRTKELHIAVIGAAGNFQVLRILALLIIVAHYCKIRLFLIDNRFYCSGSCYPGDCGNENYRTPLKRFIEREITAIDPFHQVNINASLSDESVGCALVDLQVGRTPPQVVMFYDLGTGANDELGPARSMLAEIRRGLTRPDISETLVAFTFTPTLFFCRFDNLPSLALDAPNRPDVSVQERGGATLEELDGPVTEALRDHRVLALPPRRSI